jgi:hypothetical protein
MSMAVAAGFATDHIIVLTMLPRTGVPNPIEAI